MTQEPSTIKSAGRFAVALFLWLVSSALGGIAAIQAYEATRVIAALLIPVNPLQVVMSRKQVLLVSRFTLILLMIVWVVGVILLLVRSVKIQELGRRLWRDFVIALAVELAVIGIASFAVYLIPRLALQAVP